METIFIVIGLFLGSADPQLKIYERKFVNPVPCNKKVEELNAKAKQRQEPYRFFCRPVTLTQT